MGISYSYYTDITTIISRIKTGSLDLITQPTETLTITINNPLSNTINTEENNESEITNQEDISTLLEDSDIIFTFDIKNIGTVPVSLEDYKIFLNDEEITNLSIINLPDILHSQKNSTIYFKLPLTEHIKILLYSNYIDNKSNKINIVANYSQLNSTINGWNKKLIIEKNINVILNEITPSPQTESSDNKVLTIDNTDSNDNSSKEGGNINNEN